MCPCTLPGIQVGHALVHLKVSTVLVHNAWRLTVCNFFHSATKSMDLVTVQFKDESCLSNFSCKESLWAMNMSEADEPRSVRRAVWSKTKTECTSVKLWQELHHDAFYGVLCLFLSTADIFFVLTTGLHFMQIFLCDFFNESGWRATDYIKKKIQT